LSCSLPPAPARRQRSRRDREGSQPAPMGRLRRLTQARARPRWSIRASSDRVTGNRSDLRLCALHALLLLEAAWHSGDPCWHLVAGLSSATPQGLLMTVTTVRRTPRGGLIIGGYPARLDDVIEGRWNASAPIPARLLLAHACMRHGVRISPTPLRRSARCLTDSTADPPHGPPVARWAARKKTGSTDSSMKEERQRARPQPRARRWRPVCGSCSRRRRRQHELAWARSSDCPRVTTGFDFGVQFKPVFFPLVCERIQYACAWSG
jgi:hypothetical protein